MDVRECAPVHDCLGAFACSRIRSCVPVRVCICASVSGETMGHRVHLVLHSQHDVRRLTNWQPSGSN